MRSPSRAAVTASRATATFSAAACSSRRACTASTRARRRWKRLRVSGSRSPRALRIRPQSSRPEKTSQVAYRPRVPLRRVVGETGRTVPVAFETEIQVRQQRAARHPDHPPRGIRLVAARHDIGAGRRARRMDGGGLGRGRGPTKSSAGASGSVSVGGRRAA